MLIHRHYNNSCSIAIPLLLQTLLLLLQCHRNLAFVVSPLLLRQQQQQQQPKRIPIIKTPQPFIKSTSRQQARALKQQQQQQQEIGIGIDLGTTNSAVAFLKDGMIPSIVPIPENGRTMPSVVSFVSGGGGSGTGDDTDGYDVCVGKEAIEQESHQAGHSYRNVKRVLGRGMKSARDTTSPDVVPFLVVAQDEEKNKNKKSKKYKKKKKKKETLAKQLMDAQENPVVLQAPTKEGGAFVPPELISSHIARRLVKQAEEYTGSKVTRAVVGVPAYFHDAQRDATIKAVQMAGIEKVKLLREPEAAALAYGIGKEQIGMGDTDELVLVFDLGGGTYDVSMLLVGGGLTEIICTSGNSQLGGSDFDAKIAQHLRRLVVQQQQQQRTSKIDAAAAAAMVRSAEMIRIYLSNNRVVNLALPLDGNAWGSMQHANDVILPNDYFQLEQQQYQEEEEGALFSPSEDGISNSTHVLCQLSRRTMEKLCKDEILALLRPLREVAIMAGALLPGDTSPRIVEAALEMELEETSSSPNYGEFYADEDGSDTDIDIDIDNDSDRLLLLQLEQEEEDSLMKQQKKAQQKGRKRAREVSKRERKYRQEKRKIADPSSSSSRGPSASSGSPSPNIGGKKVIDGISGRPISRVVLVGGATRMPAIGRLLAAITGVVPQKTVNPDEAVALGCAVHVGVLDGNREMGTVLNPLQSAILHAMAEQEQRKQLQAQQEQQEGSNNNSNDNNNTKKKLGGETGGGRVIMSNFDDFDDDDFDDFDDDFDFDNGDFEVVEIS